MLIASQKRKENIAEYLLYMWQIEDLIRANGLDIERIMERIIDSYPATDEQRARMVQWYESLIDMMRREEVEKEGHLQINKNIIGALADLHRRILDDPRMDRYRNEFYRTLPYIVELRAKSADKAVGEIETCFNALYGLMMMRMSGKEISADTMDAMNQISRFISLLAHDWKLDEEDKLFPPEHDKNPGADAHSSSD